jgi:phage baseplate assembly protein gpV
VYDFIDRFVELERKVAEMDRRARNRKRTGVVSEVDTAKGLARVKIMDGDRPYISPWVPWKEVAAGGIKSHIPPTVGEQVDLVSESGDLTDAVIDMSTPSNANPRPHDGPEAVITKGSVRVFISDDHAKIDAPNITFTAASGSLA